MITRIYHDNEGPVFVTEPTIERQPSLQVASGVKEHRTQEGAVKVAVPSEFAGGEPISSRLTSRAAMTRQQSHLCVDSMRSAEERR